jgi:hypothetical protein
VASSDASSTRRLAASIAAHSRWAVEPDRAAATQAARDAFLTRFEKQVDPQGQLRPAERQRRAQSAMTAHMQRLALASAKARSRRGAERQKLAAELRAAADALEAGGEQAC